MSDVSGKESTNRCDKNRCIFDEDIRCRSLKLETTC